MVHRGCFSALRMLGNAAMTTRVSGRAPSLWSFIGCGTGACTVTTVVEGKRSIFNSSSPSSPFPFYFIHDFGLLTILPSLPSTPLLYFPLPSSFSDPLASSSASLVHSFPPLFLSLRRSMKTLWMQTVQTEETEINLGNRARCLDSTAACLMCMLRCFGGWVGGSRDGGDTWGGGGGGEGGESCQGSPLLPPTVFVKLQAQKSSLLLCVV